MIYAVGLLAFQLKDYAVAERNLERLLELNYRDVNSVRYTLGQIAEEQKDWPKAIRWYETVDAGQNALPAKMRVASVMAKQGRLDEARAYLRGIVVKDEQQKVQILVAEAQILREANRYDEAFNILGQALEKEPDEPDLLYDHALTAEKLERFDVLETNLRKVIAVRPDHAHAYNALGYSFADRNTRLEEAHTLIERALELAPNDPFIVDSMGWVLYRQGDAKGAVDQLRRAWSLRPDAEIGAHLGEVLWTTGQRDEASRIWDEALRDHPDNEIPAEDGPAPASVSAVARALALAWLFRWAPVRARLRAQDRCAGIRALRPDRGALRREAAGGQLRWRHDRDGDEMLISSPLGQGLARILRENEAVTLTTANGREYRAADAEALTERVLGFRVPLAGLADWVRGGRRLRRRARRARAAMPRDGSRCSSRRAGASSILPIPRCPTIAVCRRACG